MLNDQPTCGQDQDHHDDGAGGRKARAFHRIGARTGRRGGKRHRGPPARGRRAQDEGQGGVTGRLPTAARRSGPRRSVRISAAPRASASVASARSRRTRLTERVADSCASLGRFERRARDDGGAPRRDRARPSRPRRGADRNRIRLSPRRAVRPGGASRDALASGSATRGRQRGPTDGAGSEGAGSNLDSAFFPPTIKGRRLAGPGLLAPRLYPHRPLRPSPIGTRPTSPDPRPAVGRGPEPRPARMSDRDGRDCPQMNTAFGSRPRPGTPDLVLPSAPALVRPGRGCGEGRFSLWGQRAPAPASRGRSLPGRARRARSSRSSRAARLPPALTRDVACSRSRAAIDH